MKASSSRQSELSGLGGETVPSGIASTTRLILIIAAVSIIILFWYKLFFLYPEGNKLVDIALYTGMAAFIISGIKLKMFRSKMRHSG